MNVSIQTDELIVRGEMKVLEGESAGHHLSALLLALVSTLQENWIRHAGRGCGFPCKAESALHSCRSTRASVHMGSLAVFLDWKMSWSYQTMDFNGRGFLIHSFPMCVLYVCSQVCGGKRLTVCRSSDTVHLLFYDEVPPFYLAN